MDLDLAEPPDPVAWRAASGPVDRVVSSPLRRARRAAQAFAQAAGVALLVDPRWVELDFGTWDGVAWDDVPRAALDAWAADPAGFHPGGGESVRDVLARVRAGWEDLPDGVSLLVTHAGPMRCLLHLVRGLPLADAMQATIPFGAMLDFPE